MKDEPLSIDDLAHAAGLTRRAIRFYVAQKLLPPPSAPGRAATYSRAHLDRLQQIRTLQSHGHSLDQIRQILDGRAVPPVIAAATRAAPAPPAFRARLYQRLQLLDGVELHLDTAKFNPTFEQLQAIRETIVNTFRKEPD